MGGQLDHLPRENFPCELSFKKQIPILNFFVMLVFWSIFDGKNFRVLAQKLQCTGISIFSVWRFI
jgi:hypothetical protein